MSLYIKCLFVVEFSSHTYHTSYQLFVQTSRIEWFIRVCRQRRKNVCENVCTKHFIFSPSHSRYFSSHTCSWSFNHTYVIRTSVTTVFISRGHFIHSVNGAQKQMFFFHAILSWISVIFWISFELLRFFSYSTYTLCSRSSLMLDFEWYFIGSSEWVRGEEESEFQEEP